MIIAHQLARRNCPMVELLRKVQLQHHLLLQLLKQLVAFPLSLC